MKRMLRLAIVSLSMLSACAALNPFRLEDQVALFNDDLRWGRLPAAEMQVAGAMRTRFVRYHAGWGRRVHIVDMEMESTRVSGFTGTSRAHFIWTRGADLGIRETVIETRWKANIDGSWYCEDERIVGGDPSLLEST